jgi:hypothetical protein
MGTKAGNGLHIGGLLLEQQPVVGNTPFGVANILWKNLRERK